MGVANRDYMRNRPGDLGFWGGTDIGIAPVCKYLIIANVVVFLLQIFITRPLSRDDLPPLVREHLERSEKPSSKDLSSEDLSEELPPGFSGMFQVSVVQQWLELETDKVIRSGQVWRLLTCAFCHDRLGIWHLVFNMLFLYWFGKTLETMYGSREFLLFYLTSAVVASLCFIAMDLATGKSGPMIGASGAVMGVVMLYAIHYPRQRIFIWFFFPIEIRWLVAFYIIFDLHPLLLALAGTRMFTGVAHAAHLGGLAFGYVYWRQGIRLEKYWDRLFRVCWDRRVGPRRRVRLFTPPKESSGDELDTKLDVVLRKIRERGEAILSDEDREVLRMAAERYKSRSRS